MDWKLGNPTEYGWYLAASRSNDLDELYYVHELWFNPTHGGEWWTGGGKYPRTDGPNSIKWRMPVVAHMATPAFTAEMRKALE